MTKQTYNELRNRIHVLEYENAELKKENADLNNGWTNEEHDKEVARLIDQNDVLEDEIDGLKIGIEHLEKEVEMSMENHNEILIESLSDTKFFEWCTTGKEEVVDYIHFLELENSNHPYFDDVLEQKQEVIDTLLDEQQQLQKAYADLKEINKTLMKEGD